MGWQDRAAALRERFDARARQAMPEVFRVVLPQRPDVPRLVVDTLDELSEKRRGGPRLPAFPGADAARFDELLALLEGPLGELCERAAGMKHASSATRAVRQALDKRPEVQAARDRLRELAADGLRPFPPRGRSARLEDLPLEEGLQLGCWHVWESTSGIGVLLWHQPTGRLVRIWTGSNGWWEYRTGRMSKGHVHIVWSAGNTSPKSGESYARVRDAPGPCWSFPPGHYVAEAWHFTAGKCELLIAHAPTKRVITLGLASPLMRCNDAELPDV
jgi:hypothetical protein